MDCINKNIIYISCAFMVSLTLLFSFPALGAQQLSNSDAISIIEKGMDNDYVDVIPTGKIVITKGMLEKYDPKNHIYNQKFRNTLIGYNKVGVILVNDTTNKLNMSATMGESTYNVIITEKGKKYALGTNDQGDYMFRWAKVKISKIVKNSEFTPAFDHYPEGKMDRSAEYRLVLGTYELTYTDIQNEIFTAIGAAEPKVKKVKFKTLLQYDPFKETYKYVQKDWGNIDKDDWVTKTIK